MTVAFVAQGTANSGDTSVTLAYPAGEAEGVIAIAVVDSGHPTVGTIPPTPDGWARVGTLEGGGGTYGVDTGPRRITLFIRRLASAADDEPVFTVPAGTESRVGGAITLLSATDGEVVRYTGSFGEDTTSGTSFSATGATAVGWAVDDLALLGYVLNTDAANPVSAEAIAAAGITFGTVTERADNTSAVGADVARVVATGSVTAGTGSAAPTVSATLTAAATGVAAALRLRDVAAGTGPGAVTLTYDPVLSRVQIDTTGLDANATLATVERSTDGVRWTTVRGGLDVAVVSGVLTPTLSDYEFVPGVLNTYRVTAYDTGGVITDIESDDITPTLTQVWLKSVPRPFLNQAVTAAGQSFTYQRAPRGGLFDVVGRSLPVAVTDVRGPRRYTLVLRTRTDDETDLLDLILASGDVLFLHAQSGKVVPAGGVYLFAGEVSVSRIAPPNGTRLTGVEVTEVAAPGPDVVGALGTWQTVVNTYTDWAAVVAAHTDWADLLTLVGDPTEVLVP